MKGEDTIITIDGPAGAGKSTVSRLVADALGFSCLDTGAMYRALALKASRAKTDFRDPEALGALLRETAVGFSRDGRVLLDSRDVSDAIRTAEVSSLSSELAALGEVREFLVSVQRKIGESGRLVAEGRDMGTHVFPGAAHKFYLDAPPGERARRRSVQEDGPAGRGVGETETEIRERDRRDVLRKRNPLRPAPDAVVIDTARLDARGVAREILRRASPVRPPGKK